jgi:hypothetical protein
MHKITAALISGFTAARRFASNVAVRIHAFLIDLHIANLRALVERAEKRVTRWADVARYHRAASLEATTRADEAQRTADAVAQNANAEAAAHGVTLGA